MPTTARTQSLWHRRTVISGLISLVAIDIVLLFLLQSVYPSLLYESSLCRGAATPYHSFSHYPRTFFPDSVNEVTRTKQSDRRVEHGSLLEEAHLTSNGGFLLLRENTEKAKHFGVSMFHQLHCIDMLREAILRYQGMESGDRGELNTHNGMRQERRAGLETLKQHDRSHDDHLIHCLDYVAQGIVCAADDTIEPSLVGKLTSGESVRIIEGLGVVHQCRNSAVVRETMLQSQHKPLMVNRALRSGDTLGSILDT